MHWALCAQSVWHVFQPLSRYRFCTVSFYTTGATTRPPVAASLIAADSLIAGAPNSVAGVALAVICKPGTVVRLTVSTAVGARSQLHDDQDKYRA